MTKKLEKWYLWDGIRPLPINSFKTMDASGFVSVAGFTDGQLITSQRIKAGQYVSIKGMRHFDAYPIIAYTLGEQVDSKRGAK